MRFRFLAALLPGIAHAALAQSQLPLDTSHVRQWHEDLAFLRREAPARHANLFHDMRREQFDSAITSISPQGASAIGRTTFAIVTICPVCLAVCSAP